MLQSYSEKAKGIRPFCGFSAKEGFYSEDKDIVFDAVEAKPGHSSGIPDIVSEILKILQVPVDIKVYIVQDKQNCLATIAKGGGRMLIADDKFLADVNNESGTEWAAISIIAHEVGHHISGFGRYENPLRCELDADYWCGFILQKLGASKEASVKCMKRYGTPMNTETHPNKAARIDSIEEGFDDAEKGKMKSSKCDGCKN